MRFTGSPDGSAARSTRREIGDIAVAEFVRLHARRVGAALVRFGADGTAAVHSTGEVRVALPGFAERPGLARAAAVDGSVQLVDAAVLRRSGIDSRRLDPGVCSWRRSSTRSARSRLLIVVDREIPAYHFDANDVARVQELTEQLATSLRKGMLHERIEFEARHDALTGLPGRTLFESIAAEAVRGQPRTRWRAC